MSGGDSYSGILPPLPDLVVNGALLRQLDPSQSAEHLESLNKTFVDIVKEKDARVTSFQESKGLSGSALFKAR